MINRLVNKAKLGKLNHLWITQTLSECPPGWTFDDLKKLRQLFRHTYDWQDVLNNPHKYPDVSLTCKRKLNSLKERNLI